MKAKLIVFFLLLGVVKSEDFYIANSASGSGDGSNAANALAYTFFNSVGNWGAGAGKISAGDTVHLCGTISNVLIAYGSGSTGNVVTIKFEDGAKLSRTSGTLLSITSKSYFMVDGGTNGIVENTANGTGLANQVASTGIDISGCNNVEIKNLTIRNLYVHTATSDSVIDPSAAGGVYCNGWGNNISIHDCDFSDMGWCITLFASNGSSGLSIYNNSFVNYDHGIGGIGNASASASNVLIYNNDFGSTSAWDTDANTYHHDGIHSFFGNGGTLSNVYIYNNYFHGNWGTNNTAHVFLEQNYNTRSPSDCTGWRVYNNLHVQNSSNLLNNGMAVLIGDGMIVSNNTYLGSSVALQFAISISGANMVFKNNVVSGVNRFIDATSATFAANSLNNNLYSAVVAGGNTPFRYSAADVASFAAWKIATGQDSNAVQNSDALLSSVGVVQAGSAVINSGTSLSAYFTTDFAGTTRPIGSAWDIGAYESPYDDAATVTTRLSGARGALSAGF